MAPLVPLEPPLCMCRRRRGGARCGWREGAEGRLKEESAALAMHAMSTARASRGFYYFVNHKVQSQWAQVLDAFQGDLQGIPCRSARVTFPTSLPPCRRAARWPCQWP